MRVDLSATALSQLAKDQEAKYVTSTQPASAQAKAKAPAAAARSTPPSEDTATLSPQSLALTSLAAQALSSPSLRTEKVDPIMQALRSGQYELNPSKIADAIVSDRVG